jgi:hypothetical protein
MDLQLPPDFKEFLKLLKDHDVRHLESHRELTHQRHARPASEDSRVQGVRGSGLSREGKRPAESRECLVRGRY